MCRGPAKPCPPPPAEAVSFLLELAAVDDLAAFKAAVEKSDLPLNSSAPWFSRSIGPASSPSRRMGHHLRSPLEISALYGSAAVLSYILGRKSVDVNRPCGSDGATALHCAAAGGSAASLRAVELLIDSSADADAVDAAGNRPGDVTAKQFCASAATELELLLKAPCPRVPSPSSKEKKECPPDSSLPDIKNGIFGTDEFRMYAFKVKPCSRAYSHEWTECPFVPCPEFRKGSCPKGDACEFAHGVFESWLHPAQYRTRLCKDEAGCGRRVCFFAHRKDELRTVKPTMAVSSLDMAAALLTSPSSSSGVGSSLPARLSPAGGTVQVPSSRLSSSLSFRGLDFDPGLMGFEGFELDGISNQMKRQLLSGYGLNSSSSFNIDHFMAKAIVNSKQSSFAKRSQSFIDREAASRLSPPPPSIGLSDWVSPDGKLDWGIQADELYKLRKSATFNSRRNESWPKAPAMTGRRELQQHQKQKQSNDAGDFRFWEQLVA